MECFIKKIFENKTDDSVHRQFVRFSRGSFAGRAALSLQKGEKIKLGGSFEFANDFSMFAAEISGGKVTGIVLSKENISSLMSTNGIKGNSETKNGGLFYKNNIDEQQMSQDNLKKLVDNSYASLLDVEGSGFSLKMKKKKLPKPGKSGEIKIDDKFCILELDINYWPKLKDFFMLPDCKKAKISHIYAIEEVTVDKNEKDFAKMRENAKKKGKIIRKMMIDGRESVEEKNFEA